MAGLARRVSRRVNRFLSAHLSEKRLFLQTGSGTKYIRLTPLTQLGLGASALAVFGWTAVASSVVTMDLVASKRIDAQSSVLHGAYQTRLDELAAERDSHAAEAHSAQMRFQLAMTQIARQQTALIDGVETQRELSDALDVMRDRVKQASAALGEAQAQQASLDAGDASASDNASDLSQTLQTVTGALDAAVQERDAAAAESEDLARQVDELELRMTMASKRQDEMVEQLETAVAMSLGPLEKMLSSTDLDVDGLIDTVRRNHSGMGGPLVPVSLSSKSFDDGAASARFGRAMSALDRVNLMRLATEEVPLAMPVAAGFRFTSPFGMRHDPKGRGIRMHTGVDLAAPKGTPIFATADGVVTFAGRESGYGNVVRVQHIAGTETVYAHLSRMRVAAGQQLSRGARIGDMGSTGRSTGSHLHYEVRVNGQPVNPTPFLEAAQNVLEAPLARTAAAD